MWQFLLAALALSSAAAGRSLVFEQNQGQTDGRTQYLARSRGATLFLQRDRIVASLGGNGAVSWRFPGAAAGDWQGQSEQALRVNSFTGGRERWRTDIRTFGRVERRDLYRQIDLTAYAQGRELEFDFVVHPGGDPEQIRIRLDGARGVRIAGNGDLVAGTGAGELRHRRPVSYQLRRDGKREPVASRFEWTAAGEARIAVGAYDRSRDLVIDPVARGITYFGGEQDEDVAGASGKVVCGTTVSAELPGLTEAVRGRDVFVIAGDPARLVTYLGGSGDDQATACASGQTFLVVGGVTTSKDFPVGVSVSPGGPLTPFAKIRSTHRGGDTDEFLTILPYFFRSAEYSIVSSYWGEAGSRLTALAASSNTSPGGTVAVGTERTEGARGGTDAKVYWLDSLLQVVGENDWGGSGNDRISRMVFSDGLLIAAGTTSSPDAVDGKAASGGDAFLALFDETDRQLRRATLIGGSGTEEVLALDASAGRVWLGGRTDSRDLVVQNAWQAAHGGGTTDGFAALLDANTLQIARLSYFGGSGEDEISAISAYRNSEDEPLWWALVGGTTRSQDLPVSTDAEQPRFGGGLSDGFYFRLPVVGDLMQSSYLGGAGDDRIAGFTAGQVTRYAVGTTTAEMAGIATTGRSYRAGREAFFVPMEFSTASDPVFVAKGLATMYTPGASAGGVWTVRSGDPSRLLVYSSSDPEQGPGASATVPAGQSVVLYGLADSGTADITVTNSEDGQSLVTPIRFTAAGVSLSFRQLQLAPGGGEYGMTPRGYALDAGTGLILGARPFVKGKVPEGLQLESSAPQVLAVQPELRVSPVAVGRGTLRLIPPAGFTEMAPVEFVVANRKFGFECPPLGKDLRVTVGPRIDYNLMPPFVTWEVDENRGVLLATEAWIGTQWTTAPPHQIALESRTGSGSAGIRLRARGYDDLDLNCPIYPAALGFLEPERKREATVDVRGIEYLEFKLLNPDGSSSSIAASHQLRPGIPEPKARITGGIVESETLAAAPEFRVVSYTPKQAGEGRMVLEVDGFPVDEARRSAPVAVRPFAPVTVSMSPTGQYLIGRMGLQPVHGIEGSVLLRLRSVDGRVRFLSELSSLPLAEITTTFLAPASQELHIVAGGQTGIAEVAVYWEAAGRSGEFTVSTPVTPARVSWSADMTARDVVTHAWSVPTALPLHTYGQWDGRWVAMPAGPELMNHVRIQVSDPALARVVRGEGPSSYSSALVQPQRAGRVDLLLESDLELAPGERSVRMVIRTPEVSIAAPAVGSQLVARGTLRMPPGSAPLPEQRFRIVSSDPAKLMLATQPAGPADVSAEVLAPAGNETPTFYLFGGEPGAVTVTVAVDGTELGTTPVTVVPAGLTMAGDTAKELNISQDIQQAAVQLTPLDPVRLLPLAQDNPSRQVLRPDRQPAEFPVRVAPSGVLELLTPAIRIAPGQYTNEVRYRTIAAGVATIRLENVNGFTSSPKWDGLQVNVRGVRFLIEPRVRLGREAIRSVSFQGTGQGTLSTVTATSADPARVLVSARREEAGTARANLVPGSTSGSFFVHGLAGEGTAEIRLEAPGYMPSVVTVELYPMALGLEASTSRLLTGESTAGRLVPALLGPERTERLDVRPGATVRVSLAATPAELVEMPASVVLGAPFSIRALRRGEVQLTANPPEGFVPMPASWAPSKIQISDRVLRFSDSRLTVGKNLSRMTGLEADTAGQGAARVTVTSSHPGLLLVGSGALTPGAASVTIDVQNGASFSLQGLADEGTATVTASAPGYPDASMTVELMPSGFLLQRRGGEEAMGVGETQNWRVTPVQLSRSNVPDSGTHWVRPGVTVPLRIANSNAAVVRLAPESPFPASGTLSDPSTTVSLAAVGPGTAILSLQTPDGFATPGSGTRAVVTVVEAAFGFSPPRVGYNLQSVGLLTLSSSRADGLPVTIRSMRPEFLAVSDRSTVPGSSEVTVRTQDGWVNFYLQGIAEGTGRIVVSAPGYRTFEMDIPVLPSGFVFQDEATTVSSATGWTSLVRVLPLSVLSRQPYWTLPGDISPYTLRPGVEPVTVQFLSTNPGPGLQLSPQTWNAGMARAQPSATWTGAGRTTVEIVPPAGYKKPSSRGSIEVTVQ